MTPTIHNKQTILIIDDSEELLFVLKLILQKYGYEVIVQTTANNIQTFVQETKIDLMLLDVRLPNVNGRFVCKELKSNSKTDYFPIILISASAKDARSCKECGADDFLEKPFNLLELVTKVKLYLQTHEPNKKSD